MSTDLLEQLGQRTREAEALAAAIGAVSGARATKEVFEAVVQAAADLTSSKQAALFLYDEAAGALVPKAQVGHDWESYRQIRLQPGEEMSGQVFATGTPQIHGLGHNPFADSLRPENQALHARAVQKPARVSGVAVPLCQGERVVGTLSVRSETRALTQRDLEMLVRLGEQAVLAIGRANHIYQLEEQNRELVREVANRRQVEIFLHQSEARYASIVSSAMDAIVALDEQQRIVVFNPAAEQMFGRTAAQMVGQSLDCLLPAHFRSAHAEEVRGFAQSGVAERQMGGKVVVGLRANGEQFPIEATISQGEGGGARCTTVILRDITVRQKVEEEARLELKLQRLRSEILRMRTEDDWLKVVGVVNTQLAALVSFSGCGIQFFDPGAETGRFYFPNGRQGTFAIPAGFLDAIAAGKPFYRCNRAEVLACAPDTEAGILSVVDVPFSGGTLAVNSTVEHAFSERDIQILQRFAREMDTAYRMLGDIRNLVRVEEQLLLTQFTVEHIGEAIFWIDREGLVFFVNEATCRMLEYTREELVGLHVSEIDPGFAQGLWEQTWQRIRSQEQEAGHETQHRTRTGRVLPVEVTARYLKFGNREFVCTFARDISQRKLLETQLRQSQKLEALGQLTAGIAHNFNNLLQANLANIGLAMTKGSPEVGRYLKDAETAGLRGAELVQQLMLFTRSELHDEGLQPVDLGAVIRATVSLCRKTIDGAIELPVAIPAVLSLVQGDARQLEQVLMNLLLNARDALAGVLRGKPVISTSAVLVHQAGPEESEARDYVCVEVRDNGTGMDPATQGRLFEPFFTTKEVGKGTGLGLATVFGILQRHGGWVECQSQLGAGTAFLVYVPVSVAREELTPAAEAPGVPLEGSETLLVIDDEQLVRRSTAEVFSSLGYRVLEAENGLQGLELFRREAGQIGLVLLDLSMPGLSGREVLKQLRAEDPQIKVIVFTGYAIGPEELEGVAQVVGKPFSLRQLATIVRQTLTR